MYYIYTPTHPVVQLHNDMVGGMVGPKLHVHHTVHSQLGQGCESAGTQMFTQLCVCVCVWGGVGEERRGYNSGNISQKCMILHKNEKAKYTPAVRYKCVCVCVCFVGDGKVYTVHVCETKISNNKYLHGEPRWLHVFRPLKLSGMHTHSRLKQQHHL